jgi:hypothetical protein
MEKYQPVLQFDAESQKDYRRLVDFENYLTLHLGDLGDVDGHDFGSGEFNIFIFTDKGGWPRPPQRTG